MDINFMVIVGGAVLSMIVGSIWYGPLFGKKWMEICGATAEDEAKRKEMQKAAMPLYAIQFVLTILQLFVLMLMLEAYYRYVGLNVACAEWGRNCVDIKTTYILGSILLWIGLVMPTIAGSAMWNNNPTKMKWAMFLIQSGYQLVMFLIYGFIISMWA